MEASLPTPRVSSFPESRSQDGGVRGRRRAPAPGHLCVPCFEEAHYRPAVKSIPAPSRDIASSPLPALNGLPHNGSKPARDMFINISIVEDNDSVRESLQVLINGTPGLRCMSAFNNAEAALAEIPPQKPDVILMDINLPHM